MIDTRLENLNISAEEPIITPAALKSELPITEAAVRTVVHARETIINILQGVDKRLFVVVGPCSIHDCDAAKEYAHRLKALAEELKDTLFLVMRVYFEKPRTRTGWQGMINDPGLNNSGHIETGLRKARALLLELANEGVPAAGEALDLITPQYVQDLIAWTAIGARTTESQTHRKMASGFTSAVGFKNSTDGSLESAINAIHAAQGAHNFLSVDPNGHVAVVRTKGNPNTHMVLRGGKGRPNYFPSDIKRGEALLASAGLKPNIMVDCSHANSNKNHNKQTEVLQSITEQIVAGNESVKGLMIESNLFAGQQPIPQDLTQLRYGVSVTDACLDWTSTADALRACRSALKATLPHRGQG